MRHALPFVLTAALALVPSSAIASSVTAADLVKLSAAGLSDDILIALIESDRAVFRLTADEILSLREKGLSEKVILAMLQTAKKPIPNMLVTAVPAADVPVQVPAVDESSVTQIGQADPVEPPAPVVVNVTQQVEQHVEQPREPGYTRTVAVPVGVPVGVPVYVTPGRPVHKPEPVYWGFGGQRRPDTWKEPRKGGK